MRVPRLNIRNLLEQASAFGASVPAVGAALVRSVLDPSVERIVEGVGFLSGSVLDKADTFQLAAHAALADMMCPSLTRPFPAMTILELAGEPGATVPRGTEFLSTPIEGIPCRFRTADAVRLDPLEVEGARVSAVAGSAGALSLTLRVCGAVSLREAVSDCLVIYLAGEGESSLSLLNLLCSRTSELVLSDGDGNVARLPPGCIEPVGMAPEELVLPDPDGPAVGYGVIQQYLLAPQRFLFVRIRSIRTALAGWVGHAERLTLQFLFTEPVPGGVRATADRFRLRCVTAVNLFESSAEPIRIGLERPGAVLRVAGLPPWAGGVFAVQRMSAALLGKSIVTEEVAPFRRLGLTASGRPTRHYYSSRNMPWPDGSDVDVEIRIGAPQDAPISEQRLVASADIWATNRGVASRVKPGDIRVGGYNAPRGLTVSNITSTSPHVPPPCSTDFALRLLRMVALRRGQESVCDAVQTLLHIHNWEPKGERFQACRRRIAGIHRVEVSCAQKQDTHGTIQRGYDIAITADEAAYLGMGDLALLRRVLEACLGPMSPLNTYSRVSVTGERSGWNLA